MINREEFVNEMKKALGLSDSNKMRMDNFENPLSLITTDELLAPQGVDIKLGQQIFHYDLRTIHDIDTLKNSLSTFISEQTLCEVIALLACLHNHDSNRWSKEYRKVLEKGAEYSKLCRYASALDYFYGKAGAINKERAIFLLVNTPWGGYDERLKWIDERLYRRKAAKMCMDMKLTKFDYNYNGKLYKINDYSQAKPFMEIILECSCSTIYDLKGFGDEGDVNDYAVTLFENGRRNDAFFFFKYAADLGHKYACYMVGISLLCGLDRSDKYVMTDDVEYTNKVSATRYLLACEDVSGAHGIQYECLSFLFREIAIKERYSLVVSLNEIEEFNRKGAEKGFSISRFELGCKMIEKSRKDNGLSELEKKRLREEGEELKRKAKSEINMPHWCYKGGLWFGLTIQML